MLVPAIFAAAYVAPAPTVAQAPSSPQSGLVAPNAEHRPVLELGIGDSIAIAVYGQSDMSAQVYVGDDGTVPVALAGPVHVAGLSPAAAA